MRRFAAAKKISFDSNGSDPTVCPFGTYVDTHRMPPTVASTQRAWSGSRSPSRPVTTSVIGTPVGATTATPHQRPPDRSAAA